MVLFLLFSALLLPAQTDSVWTPATSMRVARIGEVVLSPDGKLAAWTQTRAVMDAEKSENLTHIYLSRGGRASALTRGDKSAQEPAFSPDGKWLFFTSDRSGKRNIYRIPLDGGEAEMLTDWKGGLALYRVSPDGKWLAFSGAEQDTEGEKEKKEKRDVKVIDERPNNFTVWLVPVEADANGKRPSKKIFAPAYHVAGFRWAPDSKRIAFEHRPTPDFEVARLADISEVEVETGTVKVLSATSATESSPLYSPDGRYVAFVRSAPKPSVHAPVRVALLDRQTGSVRELVATPDEQPQLHEWAADSSKIYVTEGKRTRTALYAVPVDGPLSTVQEPSAGVMRIGGFSQDGSSAGAVAESSSEAPEAYLLRLSNGVKTRLSEANQWPMPPLGVTSILTWKSKDGKPVEGLLTLPVNYEKGKRVPLALLIHGGPAGAYSENFIGSSGVHSIASFAAKGYAVLRVNPRGSSAYGRSFRGANDKDWGGGDYHDIMTGVDHVISAGIADPDHMAVMGWSYGGYMTAWTVTQTQRFKAAIVGAGITNVWSMWGTNDIPSVLDDYFGGSPWDNLPLYLQRSALFFTKNVKTPVLFLHGEADNRVPIGQAYEYYHALKRLGVTTKMAAYPRTPHGPTEPKFVQDVMQRHLDWVEKYAR
ncbi:MAG: S9 family peptidase [Candidatus Solibacter usitatus]|nr:S9 family peptidase [Candidatus Solibacter usitatus]